MKQQIDLHAMKVKGENSFTDGLISIIVDKFSYQNDKHYMMKPQSAKARFLCCGEWYTVDNSMGISNVEDWYQEELLPKVQMLSLLLSAGD